MLITGSLVDSILGWSLSVVVTGSVSDTVVVGFSEVVIGGSDGVGAEIGCGIIVDVMITVLVGLGRSVVLITCSLVDSVLGWSSVVVTGSVTEVVLTGGWSSVGCGVIVDITITVLVGLGWSGVVVTGSVTVRFSKCRLWPVEWKMRVHKISLFTYHLFGHSD